MVKTPPAPRVVLDTNVLLEDPSAITKYERIVIPIFVVEELDGLKKGVGETAFKARQAIRMLNEHKNRISIDLNTTGFIDKSIALRPNKDDFILACAKMNQAVLVTNDVNMSLKAKALSVKHVNHEVEKREVKSIEVVELGDDEFIDQLYTNDFVECDHGLTDFIYVHYKGPTKSVLAKTLKRGVRLVNPNVPGQLGITPKNMEQRLALDALLDPSVHLVNLVGKTGSGKTLLALAAALHQTTNTKQYNKIVVARPTVSMGAEIGFLPGDLSEKMDPWMQPIFDNVEVLLNITEKDKKKGRDPRELVTLGLMEVQALSFIRGRSIPRQFMLIDESQNTDIHEIKTILTRAGEGTKIVLTGDPEQIDTPKLDGESNGLSQSALRLQGSEIVANVFLTQCERSPLATLVAERFQ